MIWRHFEVWNHEEYGFVGLRPLWMPDADPLQGMAVAHDMLEHFPDADGGVADELQALGAAIWVRDFGQYWHEKGMTPNVAEHLASDFVSIFEHVAYQGFHFDAPDGYRVGRIRLEDSEAERIVEEACRIGARRVREELHLDGIRSPAMRWMRIGFRRARKRWAHVPRHDLCAMFSAIEARADWILHAHGESEGLRVAIGADFKRDQVRIKFEPLDSFD